jgi:chaperonin GroES
MLKLRPLNDKVIIKSIEEKEVTKFGIVLPETAEKEKSEKGEVVAVGPGKLFKNGQRAMMSVKIGDMVLFKKYSPDEIKIGKEEYLVIEESDIIGVIEK